MLCHVSVHSGAFCLRHRVLVAFFDRVALFSVFDHLFESLDLLYIGIMLKKHFKNAHCEFYEQFSCRKRMFPIQSFGVEYKVCLRHAGGLRWQNLFIVIVESAITNHKAKFPVIKIIEGQNTCSVFSTTRFCNDIYNSEKLTNWKQK